MNTGEDEPSSGLNGRLRPRKSNASPITTKALRKLDAKPLNEKPKRTGTPSKASPNKPDDLLNKSDSDVLPTSQVLCSYCDKTFVNRQAVGKHTSRVHTLTSVQDSSIYCLFCNHAEIEPNDIIQHMVDSHPNQYFACLNCNSRFSSTSELAEHKLNVCEKQKPNYRNKLRNQTPKKNKSYKIDGSNEFHTDDKGFREDHEFNGIVISCELKPVRIHDEADIEDNITTNLILPPSKNVGNATVIEKNAVIVLDDLQWNKRIPPNFNFHNTDADQILSRLGVVHRGPRTGEPNRRDWLKNIDETNQKFERCFDTTFYSKVASNVQENLAKFLDGSCNFNPDPDNTIKTRKSKNSVAINTAEGFPILLAFEQYSRNVFDGYMPRSIAPKHKWKWDNLEHDKTLLSPEQLKRDSHTHNCIVTLVSSLDIWTQLCMRQKFEDKFKSSPLEKKAEKQNIIGKELKEILEKRELPTPSSQVVMYVNPTSMKRDDLEFPASLGLAPATPNHDFKPAVLSGEWVRPRCCICCACGFQARDSRALSSHITTQHPNAQIQHYEIVGDVLLNSDISKHLYVPPSQVNNRTRPLRGYRECTKCKKSITLEDLHQHMLDCAGDTPAVRRKCRTVRPFGVRKRRPRIPDNTIRKKIRKDIRSHHRKNLIRPRQKNRSEVGDAETIRKMLADLPAKRHRVLVNPLNSNLRPRRKFDKQRSILKMKKKILDDGNKKGQPYTTALHVNAGNERLNKKLANLRESDKRKVKSNIKQMPAINRHNNVIKRKSPIGKNKKNLRFRECKGSNDSGGKKCSESRKNTDSNQSGNSGGNFNSHNPGEGSYDSQEHGNRSDGNSNERDNQQPGCSRQNDDSRDSSDQSPNVPLKHSIAQLTADCGTQDKSVQFHHLFLVQQEYNNIPHHTPSRQKILFGKEAVVTKLDKPPIHFNHGGATDPLGQKSKTNKPRKGLNDCIAMLKNKLVDPIQPSQLVSVQYDGEEPLTNNSKTNNSKSDKQNQLTKKSTSKITHEIAVQCSDLDDEDTLADALLKELRRSQGVPSTSQKNKGKGKASKPSNDKLMKDSNDINNHEWIRNKAAELKPTVDKELEAQPSTSGLQQSVSSGFTNGDLKHTKTSRDIMPVSYTQEKTETLRSTTSNQHSVPSGTTKGSLKNIKKSQDNLLVTYTHEILDVQHDTSSIQQFLPSDSSKGTVKSTKKIESVPPTTQEKIESKLSTSSNSTGNQQSVPSEVVKSSTKNIKKSQDNLPVKYTQGKTDSQQNTNFQKHASLDAKVSLKNIKKGQNIIPVKIDAQKNITSKNICSDQSHSSDISKHTINNIKNDEYSILRTQENSVIQQSTTSTQNSVSFNVAKNSLKNKKKSEDIIPVTYIHKKMNSQQYSMAISQSVSSDITKRFLEYSKTNQDNIPVNHPQEKPNGPKNTNNNQKFVSSNATKGSLKYVKKFHDTIPITGTRETPHIQQNSTSSQQFDSTEVNKGSLKNVKKGQDMNSVSYTQEKSKTQFGRQSTALYSAQQSDYSIIAEASMKNYKKIQDIVPTIQTHENSESQQNTASTMKCLPSNIAKGYLKNIKKGLDVIPVTHSQEILDVQQCTKYQHSVSSDGAKSSLKNIRKSQDTYIQSSKLGTSTPEKYIESLPKNVKERKKSDSKSPNISNTAPEKIDSKSSNPNQDVTPLEKEKNMELIQAKKQNENDERHLHVDHSPTEYVNKTLVTYEQQKTINVVNVNLEIDDNVYNSEPGPHDRTIQNICQKMSFNEHSVMNSDTQPTHCNTQIESMLTSPLDLSGKISSTQSDSTVSYQMPMYDNYETLDLSNKNPDRNFIDEDVVDLRIKYTSTMHYESDRSTTSSIPDVATDLSLGSEQIPKDLSLKGRNRSLSRASTLTNNECINIASSRSHYDSCSSDIYEENACLDFSLRENMHTNNPNDLYGRDCRIQHIESNVSGEENNIVEHNEMHEPDIATNLSVCNRMNLNASVNSIDSYEPLHIITGEIPSHLNRHIVNPTIISNDIEFFSEDMFEPVSNMLHHTINRRPEERDYTHVSPGIKLIDTGLKLVSLEESTRDHFIPVIADTGTYMDTSEINQIPIYVQERVSPYPYTNTPLCLSETITTSLPAYNFINRTLVTPSSKYESTTPVYTLANACISVTKIESTSSATLTNTLLSIPGNTITNTTSIYTLAGTTISTPINYNLGSNPLSINNETPSSVNITESSQNHKAIDKPIAIISQEKEKVDDVRETRAERVRTNLDQDQDIAKKIALLPKELVEILGTMPLDHRKQLLNVLPQYVSATTARPSTDYGKELNTKSKEQQVSPLPDRIDTKETNVDVTSYKRHTVLNPTPPPSTLPHSLSQLSPSSVSSSFLLTPPTPNFKTRSLNTTHSRDYTSSSQNSPEKDGTMLANNELPHSKISTNTDLKVIDLCDPVIDLTGDDYSQSMTEGEVHTTSETNVQALPPKTVTTFTAVKDFALKTNNDKTASLRAVRIKTQSERHKTPFPKSQTRKESTEILVTSSNPDDTKSLTIQQGDITSTEHSNRHIITEDQISSSVSINNEQFKQKSDHNTNIGKNVFSILVESKAILENTHEVTSDIPEHAKTEVSCSAHSVNDDYVHTKLENSACLTSTSSPLESETNISNNNNVVACKYDSKHQLKKQEPDVNPKNNRKIAEDDDSDDDVTLAAIVKQRDSDRTVDKNDTQSSIKKIDILKSNADQILASAPSVEVTNMTTDLISKKIDNSEQFCSQLDKNSGDQSHNIEAKDKNKKKGRKGRRSNNLNIPKNVEQPTNDEFDINKENTVISESENIKYKDENIKSKIIELDSVCISPCNNAKEPVSTNQPYKDNTELRDERNLIDRDISVRDLSQADTSKSIDLANEQERVVLLTYDQTLNKNSTKQSKQDNLNRHDINLQKLPLIPRVVTKKLDINSPVNNITKENIDTDAVTSNKRITFSSTAESSSENLQVLNKIETASMEQTTVTPLRRSRRGKSLFIDSNTISKDLPSSSAIALEYKMPLTKKQLIFSKLLLDEEHNENIEKNHKVETKQTVQDNERSDAIVIGKGTLLQNDTTDSDVGTQTSPSPMKTNKRKKSSHIKKKNKKKKLHQDFSFANENIDSNPPLGQDTILKDSVKTSITNSHSEVLESSECSAETQNQEQISLDKSKEANKEEDIDLISSQERALENKAGSIEKRKPDISTDIDALASSKPKKSKGYDDIINQDEIVYNKVVLKTDTTISDYKAKARTTTCYNKPVAARRARSKSVFVNSSVPEYYDPYDIDLEEMNEISETMNRKIALRKASYSLKKPNSTVTSTSKNSEIDEKGSECSDAVPSTSKNVTISLVHLDKNKRLQEIHYDKLDTQPPLNKETTSDSDDSSKSDIPLKKYVEEKEKKMLDSNENLNKDKGTNQHNTSRKARARNKNKRGAVTNKNTGDTKTQSSENEAQLRSEQFMESFGFFSERKPRKSNLLATKKISETLHKIANETDDVYFGIKKRCSKRTVDKRHVDEDKNRSTTSKESKQGKKPAKRSRKKKSCTLIERTYCQICKREFRRSDNYLRHLMSWSHICKLSEVEINVKITPVKEEPNHLIAYKLQLDRVQLLHDKIAKRKDNSLPTNDIILPTIEEMLANVKSTVQEQKYNCRNLSRDEALFIDCCHLLTGSHNRNHRRTQRIRHGNNVNRRQATAHELKMFAKKFKEITSGKSDGDSITSRNVIKSDEVRNLKNDLITGFKEAPNANIIDENHINCAGPNEILRLDLVSTQPSCSSVNTSSKHAEKQDKIEETKLKPKRSPEYKEKMYPDIIENIDMFEDKFDKIKRKCRSQAAAASKQSQAVPEASSSHKVRKNKKKGKKKAKNHQNIVMTKGALKGFEGIKVSIVTTEINMSAIMPPLKKSSKKKKKNQSKKKREKKCTEMNIKTNDDGKDEPQQKKIDVYEFMDTDDAEVFDFRPSTIMERFKSISNKDIPSTSKNIGKYNEVEVSSDSASDGDDFVYMSDDYVCSEDETENSIMSCELRNVNEPKKSSPFKRKDVTEKSAVMGKIFKNNAVRSEKKNLKNKDIDKPKANLDQLFDSLLEEQPHSSKHVSETVTSQSSKFSPKRHSKSPSPKQTSKSDFYEYDEDNHHVDEDNEVFKNSIKLGTPDDTDVRSFNTDRVISFSNKRLSIAPIKRCNISPNKFMNDDHIKHTNNKNKDSDMYSNLSLKKSDQSTSNDLIPKFSRRQDITPSPELFKESNDEDLNYNAYKSKNKCQDKTKIKSSFKLIEKERRVSFDCHVQPLDTANLSDDGGVARQRVQRKCAVGKQNVLAETWSSESEPDGMPPRPNSAESIVVGGGRRRKGRKKEGHLSGNRKGNSKIPRKNDFESRVNSKSRNASSNEVIEYNAGGSRSGIIARSSGGFARPGQSFISHPGTSNSASAKSRPRPPPYYWSEGDDEQEHLQQHGWIVGDSHKKLVTMLAHAKGRKRNNDEKRQVVE